VIAEGFDVAIRVRFPPLEPTDLVMRRLDESIQCLVASPALIRTPLSSPSALSGLPSLGPGPAHRDHQWQLDHRDGQTALIPHRPRLITDDIAVLVSIGKQSGPRIGIEKGPLTGLGAGLSR
jgi:DNA-binding transcriptional LysR family regulator